MLRYFFNIRFLIVSIFLIVLVKNFIFLLFKIYGYNFFGGGNDADYYHAYAKGEIDVAVNVWPLVLKFLADLSLYSRDYIAYVLFFISVFVIPYLVACLSVVRESPVKKKVFLIVFLIVSIYPNLFFMSLDIYRDVFMVFLFLLGLFVFRSLSFESKIFFRFFLLFFGAFFAVILYGFRPYLGFGYLSALLFSWAYSFNRYPFYISVFFLISALCFLFVVGVFDPVIKYRSIFQGEVQGGSNIGIIFDSNLTFGFDFVKSFLIQMMGFYFPNNASILAFISESIVFIYLFIYLIKNRKFSTRFVNYLIVFFVFYGIVWLLGNDNLGSATRLRMFNYIPVYIAAFIVFQRKMLSKNEMARI